MAEVRVIARFVARKGKEDQLRALLQGMLAPTRAEPGCKLYELYESNSTGRFYFYETWESQAALDQHAATPHFKQLEQTVGDLVRELFEVNLLKRIQTSAIAA
jgi:quinol monooxygenase YgiN